MSAAGAGVHIENENYRRLFVTTFPGTEFLKPSEICSCFEINDVWKLSQEESHYKVDRVVASLQLHSMLLLSTLESDGVYHANLKYKEAPANVTRITGADLVPQHAYYYLVMKIYELFLHPTASENMFRHTIDGIAQFITEQLNSGLADGRAFFEDKVRQFLQSDKVFLKSTNPQELQNNINAIWDLLRSDTFKPAGYTMQEGFVSTIAFNDVNDYKLASQGKVTPAAEDAFKKTVYGFHVLVYIRGHVISMSLSRRRLFNSKTNPSTVFSFFNSDMIEYLASKEFMMLVREKVNTSKFHHLPTNIQEESASSLHQLFFVECGCKSPVIVDNSTGTLNTNTILPGRREPIVGQAGDGRRYILVDNFPLPDSMNTTLYVTSSDGFPNLPNFCEYDNIAAVNRVLGIEFGDSAGSLYTLRDSPPQSLGSEYDDKKQADLALSIALQGASTVQEVMAVAAPGAAVDAPGAAVDAPGASVDAPGAAVDAPGASAADPEPAGGIFGKVTRSVGAACNFIRGIFFPTPTCSAEDSAKNYANIGFRDHVVFCVPTEEDDSAIKKGSSMPGSTRWDVVRAAVSAGRPRKEMTSLSWLKARELWLGVDDSHRGGRRPISRKYRNVKKNISRKKGKKRMSLRHRRSRRRLRRRSRSLRVRFA